MISFAIALFGTLPSGLADPVIPDRVDVIEVNHCYQVCNGNVSHRYSQVIFWPQRETIGPLGPQLHLRVAKYVMFRDEVSWREGCVTIKHNSKTLRVTAPITIETWTAVDEDPEILDRAELPQDSRRGIVGMETHPVG